MASSSEDKAMIELLCDLEGPHRPKFSPDGQKLVYSVNLNAWGLKKGKHAVESLWIAKPGVENSSHKITSGEFHDSAPAWHPNGEYIVFISDRAEAGKKWALYTLGISGDAQPRAITPTHHEQRISSFGISPNGKYVAYISGDERTPEHLARVEAGEDVEVWGEFWQFARLRILDLTSGDIKTVDLDRDVHELCWKPDGDEIVIITSATPDLEDGWLNGTVISVVNAETASVARDMCVIPTVCSKLAWANDGKIYFRGNVPLEPKACGNGLYSVDENVASGKYEWAKFGYEDDVEGLEVANGTIVAFLECELESRICTLKDTILFSERVEVEEFDVFFTEQDSAVIAVVKSDIENPPEIYTAKVGGSQMIQVSNHGKAFKSRPFGTCDYLSFPSADMSTQLNGTYFTPTIVSQQLQAGAARKPLPTVVLIHGGPNSRHTNSFHPYYFYWANILLDAGYGILVPNYRGSTGGGKKFAAVLDGALGVHNYNDVITATQYAITEGYVDKDKLVVGGYSHGGYLTFCSAVRNGFHGHGWKFKAAIVGGGICDTESEALTSDLGALLAVGYNQGRVTWNMDKNDLRNRQGSPLWEVNHAVQTAKATGEMVIPPMLILHGKEDVRVHVSQATGMRRALLAHKLPFECAIYPRVGHIIDEQKAWIDMALRVKRYCNKHVGGVQNPA